MKKVMASLFFMLIMVVFAQKVVAQTRPSLADMERQMAEMQRRMFQDMQRAFDGFDLAMPRGDSTSYYFHFDTTIIGDGGSGFFHFSPFGSDTTMRSGGFLSFDKMLQDFFNQGQTNPQSSPESRFDDGNRPADELLPEERLRQEEPGSPSMDAHPKQQPAAPQTTTKKSTVKTIRI